MTNTVAQLLGPTHACLAQGLSTQCREYRVAWSRGGAGRSRPLRKLGPHGCGTFPHLQRGVRPETAGSPGPALGPRGQAEKLSSDQRPPSLLQAAVTAEVTAHSVEPARARWPGKIA